MWNYGWLPVVVSYHPVNFGGNKQCASGDMFLVVEEEDSTCPRLNLSLLFISKGRGFKAYGMSY